MIRDIAWKRRTDRNDEETEFENRALPSNPTGFDPDNRGVGCPVTNLARFHGEQEGGKKGKGG